MRIGTALHDVRHPLDRVGDALSRTGDEALDHPQPRRRARRKRCVRPHMALPRPKLQARGRFSGPRRPQKVLFRREAARVRATVACGTGGFALRRRAATGAFMRIFMFKSRPKPSLRAFAGESTGARLPAKYGPWDATGVIRPDKDPPPVTGPNKPPPHKFARADIEAAINGEGFQLWVTKPMVKAEAEAEAAAS